MSLLAYKTLTVECTKAAYRRGKDGEETLFTTATSDGNRGKLDNFTRSSEPDQIFTH